MGLVDVSNNGMAVCLGGGGPLSDKFEGRAGCANDAASAAYGGMIHGILRSGSVSGHNKGRDVFLNGKNPLANIGKQNQSFW